MTPISSHGKTKAQKCKVTRPDLPSLKEQSWIQIQAHPAPEFSATALNLPSLEHGPSGFKRVEGPLWRHERATTPGPSPRPGDLCPGEVTQQGRVYPSPGPRYLGNLLAKPQQVPTTSCQAGIYRERMYRQADQEEAAPQPHIPLSISELSDDWPAPTFPGPSALGTTSTAMSPKPHCQ